MEVDLVVGLIGDGGSFVFPHSLCVILEDLIEHTHFHKGVRLSFQSERVGQDRVLEVGDGLLNLIGLSEDHAELVEHLTLLIKVRRHLEDSNQSTDGVII